MKALGIAAWVLAVPGLALAAGDVERLTVDQAVDLALRASDLVQSTAERKAAAEDSADSARGRLLPTLSASDSVQWFKSPLTIGIPPTRPGAPPTTLEFRDLSANLLTLSASQPLLGLLHLTQTYAAANLTADAAGANLKTARSAVREAVRTGFLRLFQARAQQEIAKASQAELADQLAVAKAKYQAGVLTTADLLRIEVAQANARQQQIQAEVQEKTTRSNLLVTLGRDPVDPSIEFLEPKELESAPLPAFGNDSAESNAVARRPEVASAEAEASAASHQQWATLFELFPEVNAQGSYIRANARVTGETFPAIEASYVGLSASWPFWQWGASFFSHRAAAHQASAARLAAEDQRRSVSVDASNKLELAKASAAAVEVAQAAIASAEEAFRVTQALVKAGSATTTDLLDAQSALTTAKLNLVTARYNQAIALVALDRATGN